IPGPAPVQTTLVSMATVRKPRTGVLRAHAKRDGMGQHALQVIRGIEFAPERVLGYRLATLGGSQIKMSVKMIPVPAQTSTRNVSTVMAPTAVLAKRATLDRKQTLKQTAQGCGENAVLCENQEGSFKCWCKTGWTGNTCNEDVNECLNGTQCASDANSECRNSNGSYSCDCKEGYERVTPSANCTVDYLFPYDDSVGQRLSGDDEIFGPFYIPEGFLTWGTPHVAFFVGINGYISFDSKFDRKTAPDVPSPVLEGRSVIAPFWADIEIPSENETFGLYHQELSLADTFANDTIKQRFEAHKSMIGRTLASEDSPVTDFNPTYIAVLTWKNVLPYKADNFRDIQAATFQLVLTTDSLRSFAIINYRTVWPASINVNVPGLLHVVGTVAGHQETWNPLAEALVQVVSLARAQSAKLVQTSCFGWMMTETAQPAKCGIEQESSAIVVTTALLWGDPHLITLDGAEYSFNGWGEYVILKTSDGSLEVQGRTSKLQGFNVTVFTAFALKNENDPPVEVQHADNSGNGQLKVLLNGTEFLDNEVMEDNTYLEKLNSAKDVQIILTSGVSIMVSAMSDRLSLKFLAPPGDLQESSGLLGYVDGDDKNDFMFRNGTFTDSQPEHIFQFGQSWLIPNENQSLFTYQSGSDFASYQHQDFVPIFLPSTADAVLLALNDTRDIGSALCGTNLACLQDFLVTNDNDTALATKTTLVEVQDMQSLLAAKPPEFDNPQEVWNVSLSSGSFSYDIRVKADSDSGAYPVVQLADTPGTWRFVWTLNKTLASQTTISVTFQATNSANMSAVYTPFIILCACGQPSQCYYQPLPGFTQQYAARGGTFYSVECDCGVGTAGRFCEQEVPVCESCYMNATCNENATDGNYCLNCPDGYMGNGVKCYEVNECLEEGSCDQTCVNTVGGYACSCDSGYRLEGRSTCAEVDECAEKEDNCTPSQFCKNTPGSFQCLCRPGSGGHTCQVKVSHVYVGSLVFVDSAQLRQGWSNDLENPTSEKFRSFANRIQAKVSSALTAGGVYHMSVTVLEFKHLLEATSQRRRRSVDSPQAMIQATYQVDTNSTWSTADLDTALASGYSSSCTGNLCPFGATHPLMGVSRNESTFDADYDLCSSDRHNNCHNPSTDCYSESGAFNCTCRQGYRRWDLSDTACEDVDECDVYNITYNCGVDVATMAGLDPDVMKRMQRQKSRQDSMHKYTDFRRSGAPKVDEPPAGDRRSGSGMQQYTNPVFTRDEQAVNDRL
ncbi:hypothetical protein BaRGS_00031694, partial [Batillaria attramentaria]